MRDEIAKITRAHNNEIDSLIAFFQGELDGMLATAKARTAALLREEIALTKAGKISRSAKNSKILRKFDSVFLEELDRAGYQHLLNELVARFPGQLQYFQSTIDALGQATKKPLGTVNFTPRDLRVFSDQALNAKDSLNAVMESVAAQAKNRILLSVGGLTFPDLAESISKYLGKALPEAVGLAETATATYYAIIAERGYQIIEKDLPSQEIRYKYYGPDDKLTRPFCHRLEQLDKTYTRAEIDRMNNGQIPNVFISRGGWRCRHQWLLSLNETAHSGQLADVG